MMIDKKTITSTVVGALLVTAIMNQFSINSKVQALEIKQDETERVKKIIYELPEKLDIIEDKMDANTLKLKALMDQTKK